VSDATSVQIQTAIVEQLERLEKLRTDPVTMPKVPTPPDTGDTGAPEVVKVGGTFEGFATGFVQTGENGSGKPRFFVDGRSEVILDPETNSVTGKIEGANINRLILPKSTSFALGFRGEGDNAYVNDNTFLALGDDGSTTVVQDEVVGRWVSTGRRWWQKKYVLENVRTEYEQVTHDGSLISLPSSALCEDCDFLKFGTWASDVTYGDNVDKMGGWWVASNDIVQTVGQLPDTGSAFYAGNAVGTFAKRVEGTWQQGIGTGGATLDWDFAQRRGDFRVSEFGTDTLGRKNFGGTVRSPGEAVHYNGVIAGGGGIGATRGTFVGPRPGQAPRGVMGDFGISGGNWRANGVYGAAHVPNVPR